MVEGGHGGVLYMQPRHRVDILTRLSARGEDGLLRLGLTAIETKAFTHDETHSLD